MNKIKRPSLLDIPLDDPFRFDRLGHKEICLKIRTLLWQIEGPFVLAINADWGFGKTTLLRMLKAQLENEGFQCLLFNAWENDFAESPLVALISELRATINHGGRRRSRLMEAAKKAAAVFSAKGAAKLTTIVLKAGARKVLGEASAEELSELIEVAESSIEEHVGDALKDHEASKKTLDAFTLALKDFADAVRSPHQPPIIFFIDELDRCRPDYAISLLEVAKHLFSVEGVVFVLALNTAQLANSIRALYGEGFDAVRYLRRFVDLQWSLPIPEMGDYVRLVLENSVGNDLLLLKEASDEAYIGHKQNREIKYWEAASELLTMVVRIKRLVPRDVEQLAAKLAIALRLQTEPDKLEPLLLVACMVALYHAPDEFVQATPAQSPSNVRDVLRKIGIEVSVDHKEPIARMLALGLEYYDRFKLGDQEVWVKSSVESLKAELANRGAGAGAQRDARRVVLYLMKLRLFSGFKDIVNAALLTKDVSIGPDRQLDPAQPNPYPIA